MARNCRFGAAPVVCLLVLGGPVASASDNLTKHHALSLVGAPKHGPDFTHFDWVNPERAQGRPRAAVGDGHLRLAQPVPGQGQPGRRRSTLIYDTLMMHEPRRGRRPSTA